MFKVGRTSKRITCRNILALIQFSQNLMQGGYKKEWKDPFRQLPHINEEECNILRETLEGMTLYKYIALNSIERKALVYNIFRGDQVKFDEHEKCIDSLPYCKVDLTAEVIGGNSEICVGDFLTVKIKVNLSNLKKGE
jgi:hypothetical protein